MRISDWSSDVCSSDLTPLRQLTELFPDLGINICGINRNGNMIVPDADDHMEVADEIYFCTLPDHVLRAMRLFGHEEREARRIVISGGGNIGLFLAREIEETQPSVMLKMIESNKARAELDRKSTRLNSSH